MKARQWIDMAIEAGASESLAEFLYEHTSRPGHHHTVDQITDLEEAIHEVVEEVAAEEEDEEDEEK